MLVHQILTSKADSHVVTVPPNTSVSDAAKVLAEKRIGTVVVSRDGLRAEGILSERDIVREVAAKGPEALLQPVHACMTRDLTTAQRDDKVDAVLAAMTEGRFRHMPVVEGDTMVGLITIGDVVKAKLAVVAMEKTALEGMIMGY